MVTFQKGAYPNVLEYPLTQEQLDKLKPCDLVNPVLISDERVLVSPQEMWTPLKPGDKGYDKMILEVVTYNKDNIVLPEVFKTNDNPKYNPKTNQEFAELVHNDRPIELILEMVKWLKKDGAKIRKGLFPKKNHKVWSGPMIDYLLGWAVHTVHPTAFAHKYYHGIERPEEAIGEWAKGNRSFGENTDFLLETLLDKSKIAKDPRTFTLYPEGSPNHPELGAMHSSAAACGLILNIIFDLNLRQQKQCKLFTHTVSFCRTVAKVHTRQGNYYGLELGEKVIAKKLDNFLVQFDADPVLVRKLCKKFQTNWRNYNPRT